MGFITSEQIRAGRALVRWTIFHLSERSAVGSATIKRIESMAGVPNGRLSTLQAIQTALEAAGVEFVGTPSDGPGVRLGSISRAP